jgi:hypothetical protein
MPVESPRHDVVGKARQRLDHDVLLNRHGGLLSVVIVSSPRALV